jgi:hypothetical protein
MTDTELATGKLAHEKMGFRSLLEAAGAIPLLISQLVAYRAVGIQLGACTVPCRR